MRKPLYFIGILALLFGCGEQETDLNLLVTLREATDQLEHENDSRVNNIKNQVEEKGNRSADVDSFNKLTDILFQELEDVPDMKVEFLKSIEDAELGVNANRMDQALAGMEHYSELNKQEENEFNYLMWKMNKVLVQRELINQVSRRFGARDISFEVCCGVNVNSNMNKQNVGKEVSVVLTNPTSGVEMAYRNVQIMKGDVTVKSEITLIDDVAIVRFTPAEQGNYMIKFESVVSAPDTTIINQIEVPLDQ